jgi:hypothetical protein
MPAFVSHTMEPSARAYFVQWFNGRKRVDSKRRTGEAARTGAHTASMQGLVDDLVRRQGQVDAIDAWDGFVKEFGITGQDGKPMTWDEAEREAARYSRRRTAWRWCRCVTRRRRYSQEAQQAILKDQGPGSLPDLSSLTITRADAAQRLPVGASVRRRNVVLVPAQAAQRFM